MAGVSHSSGGVCHSRHSVVTCDQYGDNCVLAVTSLVKEEEVVKTEMWVQKCSGV